MYSDVDAAIGDQKRATKELAYICQHMIILFYSVGKQLLIKKPFCCWHKAGREDLYISLP